MSGLGVRRMLHEQLAVRWWRVRLAWQGAIGAASASALAWLLGASSAWHLGALLAGAALGAGLAAARPSSREEPRALGWMASQVGLAYETAWEQARGPADPSALAPAGAPAGDAAAGDAAAGLRAAVAVQARLSVRDLRPPPVAAWWLPLATVAVGLWWWSALGGAGPTPFAPGGPGLPPSTPSASAPAPSPDDVEEEAPVEVPPDDPTAVVPEAADAPTSESEGGAGGAGGAAGRGAGDGSVSERDALERFLENLRERPEPEDEPEPAEALAGPGEPADDAEAERAEDAPPEGGEPTPGEAGDADSAPGTEEAEAAGEPGAGEPMPAEPGEEGQEGAEDGADGEPGADAPAPGLGDGDESEAVGIDEGGDEGLAGASPGVAGEATDPLGAPGADPEPLPSVLGPGPELPVGGLQLPGVAPEGEAFPVGEAGADFRRSVERALLEGEVPVPYQDVIRNYFR